MQKQVGRLELITGPALSGKTDELIRRVRQVGFAHQKLMVFRGILLGRGGYSRICSEAGSGFDAFALRHAGEILDYLVESDIQVIAIDDVHFFGKQIVNVVDELLLRDLRVIVAGLDLDFRALPFGQTPVLMAMADNVMKLSAICTICTEPASRSQRLVDGKPAYWNDPPVFVGLSDRFEPRCRKHHQVNSGSRPQG